VTRSRSAALGLLVGLLSADASAGNFGASRGVQINHTWPIPQTIPSQYGDAVDLTSTFAAIGAPEAELVEGLAVGAVFLFESKESSLTSHTTLYGATADGSFGSSLALAPPLLAVGASTSQELKVFRYDGASWQDEVTLTKPELTRFATSLALDETSLVVGSLNPQDVGWVTSYHFDGAWVEDPPLLGKTVGGRFGRSLALDGDLLVIGAPTELLQGSVYFATRQGTVFTLNPTPLEPSMNPEVLTFGASLALSGDGLLAVGAPNTDAEMGAVLVYHQDDPENPSVWALLATLRPPDGVAPRFGNSLDFVEGSLLVGAPGDGSGRVYIYNSPVKAIEPPSLTLSDVFQPNGASYGQRLATSGRRALVGAPAPQGITDGDALGLDLLYALGNPCDDELVCASAHCVDGLCCDTVCDGPCERCSVDAGGGANGTCLPLVCAIGLVCIDADDACGLAPETTGGETGDDPGETTDATTGPSPSLDLDPWSGGCTCTAGDDLRAPPSPALALALLALGIRRRRARR